MLKRRAINLPNFNEEEMFQYLNAKLDGIARISMEDVWGELGREFGLRKKQLYVTGKRWIAYAFEKGFLDGKVIEVVDSIKLTYDG